MKDIKEEMKQELKKNWEYFVSIHPELAKHKMNNFKWICICEQECVDIQQSFDWLVEKCQYGDAADKPILIVQLRKKLEDCEVSTINTVQKELISFSDSPFKEFKPTIYGGWEINEEYGDESEYPVKSIQYVQNWRPIVTFYDSNVGKFVSIRLVCDSKGKENKTYLGLYIGGVPNFFHHLKYEKDKKHINISQQIAGSAMPAIYVPELRRVIFGNESWWGVINDPNKVREITDGDLDHWKEFVTAMLKIQNISK